MITQSKVYTGILHCKEAIVLKVWRAIREGLERNCAEMHFDIRFHNASFTFEILPQGRAIHTTTMLQELAKYVHKPRHQKQ